MNYKNFERILRTYKKIQDTHSVLYDLGFDFYEGKFKLSGHTDDLLDEILKSHYTEEGIDWINWFIFETKYGKEDMKGRDENDKPICYDMKSTYEYCEQYRFTSDNYTFNKEINENDDKSDEIYWDDVNSWSDFEVAEFLDINEDEVDYNYRQEAVNKLMEQEIKK